MNFTKHISDYLAEKGEVAVPGFGVFKLENAKAAYDPASKSFLPPAKISVFSEDYGNQDYSALSWLAAKEDISVDEAGIQLKNQTDFWKNKIASGQPFEIENLGKFVLEGEQMAFRGSRIEAKSPDFYGLEQINIAEASKSENYAETENSDRDYKLNKSVLWIFLLAIPVAGMVYLAATQSERLFGKKSFDDLSTKTSTKRIETDSAKTDTLNLAKADSWSKDSVSKAVPVTTAKKWTSKKKWSPKKYTGKKWRAKKRRNH